MLKLKDVAKRLNCSLANVYALVESGELSSIPIGANGKGLRVSEEQLKTFLDLRERKPADPPAKHKPARSRSSGWF